LKKGADRKPALDCDSAYFYGKQFTAFRLDLLRLF
jgi:hypothetical protein